MRLGSKVVNGNTLKRTERYADSGFVRCPVCGMESTISREMDIPLCWCCGEKLPLPAGGNGKISTNAK